MQNLNLAMGNNYMERIKRILICPVLAVMVMLSGCAEYQQTLESKNKADLDAQKEQVTDYMETCLNE